MFQIYLTTDSFERNYISKRKAIHTDNVVICNGRKSKNKTFMTGI